MGRNYNTKDVIEEAHSYHIHFDKREIFLQGHIIEDGADPGTEWRMATTFLKNMRLLNDDSGRHIIVHQNNIGGEWLDGMAIYDSIANCGCHVILIGHGSVISMGSIIIQGADCRLMMPHAELLIHDGETDICEGMTYKQAQSWSKKEHERRAKMIEIFADRCSVGPVFKNKSKVQIKSTINTKLNSKEDWFLTPEEAVEYGFIDGIVGQGKYQYINDLSTLKLG